MSQPKPQSENISEKEKLAWLRLSRTDNVGPVTFYKLIEAYGSASEALDHLPELSRRGGRKKPLSAPVAAKIEREYEALRSLGGDIITAAENMPSDAHENILSHLSFTPLAIDELIRACHLSIPVVQTSLLELELAGRVKRTPSNKVSLLQEG